MSPKKHVKKNNQDLILLIARTFLYKSTEVYTFLITFLVLKQWFYETEKLQVFDWKLKKSFKKNKIPQHQHLRQVKMYNSLSLFHHLEYVFTHSISLI